jgi:transposase
VRSGATRLSSAICGVATSASDPTRPGGSRGKGFTRAFDPDLYRRRNVIERRVGWLAGCRSIATRHEMLAVNFTTLVKLAFMSQYPQTISALEHRTERQIQEVSAWAAM